MLRAVRVSSKWYTMEIADLEGDAESIEEFVDSGNMVILTDDIDELRDLLGEDVELTQV